MNGHHKWLQNSKYSTCKYYIIPQADRAMPALEKAFENEFIVNDSQVIESLQDNHFLTTQFPSTFNCNTNIETTEDIKCMGYLLPWKQGHRCKSYFLCQVNPLCPL